MSESQTPWEPPLAADEIEHLIGALNRLRLTFRWKADDLSVSQLAQRFGASELTLAGLLKHLAFVEDYTFTVKMLGEPLGEPWDSLGIGELDEWAFRGELDENPTALYAFYDSAITRANARLRHAIGAGGLDQLVAISTPDGEHANLRRLVCDLIEEYGRHTGHADLIREVIDGRVGEDPPLGWVPSVR